MFAWMWTNCINACCLHIARNVIVQRLLFCMFRMTSMCCRWWVWSSASLTWLKFSLWYCWSCCANFQIANYAVLISRLASKAKHWHGFNHTMEEHISCVVKTAFFLIYNIGLTRNYLTQEVTEVLVHAYIIKTGLLSSTVLWSS